VNDSREAHEFTQALAALGASHVATMEAGPLEKIEMLAEMALGLQQKPKSVQQLHDATALYDHALRLCLGADSSALREAAAPLPDPALSSGAAPLLAARLRVRKASALRAIPGPGIEFLSLARNELERALPVLRASGADPEEVADAEMSLGVVLQSLAGVRAAKITDAIAAYQRATRVFARQRFPREFAILQNNLATAYLSIPVTDERSKMREALAVQAFSEALAVVTLVDDPVEYAMLQNNLGNALQYAASGHPIQNNLRALEAYDEALKVRTARDTPVQYANTVANRANCLRNLPDDPARPDAGNRLRLMEAVELYTEAARIFLQQGELEKAELVREARDELRVELGDGGARDAMPRGGLDFGESRIGSG